MADNRSRRGPTGSRRDGGERADERRPLIVTEDSALLDDLLRLCAAAGVGPEVAHEATAESWRRAPLVIVGADRARAAPPRERRAGVVLVTRDPDDARAWQTAVGIGAEHVLVLPDAEDWLVDRIADAVEGAGPPALTVGVVGGRGGAGASTLACALAVTSARRGERTLLVDADPLGGGLDVLLGGEKAEGLRWPAFAESRGRVAGSALAEALPEVAALRVLSWDRGDSVTIPPPAVRAVLSAARRRGGVVVVDLPRRVDESVVEALAQVDLGLLVVPRELRAVAAAARVASTVRMVLDDVRLVTASPGGVPGVLPDVEIARLLALPMAGEVPWEDSMARAVAKGTPPGASSRGALARFCDAFWEGALPQGVAERPAGGGEGALR